MDDLLSAMLKKDPTSCYLRRLQVINEWIEECNENDHTERISFKDFFIKLQALGGINESALSCCSAKDLEGAGLPRLLAKQVANFFFKANPLLPNRTAEEMDYFKGIVYINWWD